MIKSLNECVSIFLDTSVLINLLKLHKDTTEDSIIFSRELVDYLIDNKAVIESNKKIDRKFYYSTITLSEMILIQNNQEKIKKIHQALSGYNIEIVSFHKDIALHHNSLFNFTKDIGRSKTLFPNDHKLGREWISKDMMLIATASYLKIDLILTADKHDFKPLADKMGVMCKTVYRESFKVIKDISLFNNDNEGRKKLEFA